MKTPRLASVRVTTIVLCGFILLAGAWIVPLIPRIARNAYENMALMIDPSAARAYEYGSRHLSSREAAYYDVNRAQVLFEHAAQLDPNHPTVYHQIARTYFLRGEYGPAMIAINTQIQKHGTSTPSSFYVRGLIEGFMGSYNAAAEDYAQYLQFDPLNWAGLNDDAWVLLKAQRFDEALTVIDRGLAHFPDNPWLLNNRAIALYELHRYAEALSSAQHAGVAVETVTKDMWLKAYPGNDPLIAQQGIDALKKAIHENIHRASEFMASSTVQ